MSKARILVAGVGNIFLGDDAFGIEVVQRLALRQLPEHVRVIDFGIRGLDLTYALLDGYQSVILVDAIHRGDPPGTLYVLEPEAGESLGHGPPIEGHAMDPVRVLRLAAAMGGRVDSVLVVGCEPSPIAEEDMQIGLSEPVRRAVDEALDMIESLVGRLLRDEPIGVR